MTKLARILVIVVFGMLLIIIAVIPSLVRRGGHTSAAPCFGRLVQIQTAKVEWALEHNKTTNDVPRWDDLYPYLAGAFTNSYWTNGRPVCPEGGTYTLGRVGVSPTCSIGGPYHSLPP